MSTPGNPENTNPKRRWFVIIPLLILMLAWIMQAYSLMDWEGALELGIQNESFSGNEAERAWALESWGLAVADMIWPLPLTILALIGIFKRRFYGLACGLMTLAIGVYFPLFFAFQRWVTYPDTVITALILFTIPSLGGIIALFSQRKEFQ